MLALLLALTLAQDGVAPTPEAQSTPRFAHPTVKVTSTKTTVSVTIASADDVHSMVLVSKDGKPSFRILPTKTHKKNDKTFASFVRPQGDFVIAFTSFNKDKKSREFRADSSGDRVRYRVEVSPAPPTPQRQWTQPRYFVPPAPSHRHT